MKIERLVFREIRIPFREAFVHSSASRSTTESIWVEAHTADGYVGRGEACPRSYVTGETVSTAHEFFRRNAESLTTRVRTIENLRAFVRDSRRSIDANPAAFCAIELAILDALGLGSDRTVESVLGLPEPTGSFQYTAVIGDGPYDHFAGRLRRYLDLGFEDLKLKLSGNLELDRRKLELADSTGFRIRVDANNLWQSTETACGYIRALGVALFGVEEPLTANRHAELATLAERCGARVILDESFLRLDQLPAITAHPDRFCVNARVSKLGGLIRSTILLDALRAAGIPVIVGAHVGETSLLTRAGLTLATHAGNGLLAQEGAFGTLLLREDACDPPLMIGTGGRLPAPSPGAGFGLRFRATTPFLARCVTE